MTIKIKKIQSGRYQAIISNGHRAEIDSYEGKWLMNVYDENDEHETYAE